MALIIRTTGLENYAPGGQAVLKTMFIGGPGAGKTRLSSFWPRPIYADCEGGLASIADRTMPYVEIKTSQDMLDFLVQLKLECRRPQADRDYRTVVIDTLDAFQRKVKDEWLQANPGAQSFRGFDAWGYLDAKMQMLLTRLLNLDMNVIVNVHYKDKTIREGVGENATERQELMLQLSGDVKDNVFNDFDLVGWIGKYYEAVDGQRVEKRGITFKSTPDKPFLKDRLFVTPPWMEVEFAESDYETLFSAFSSRLDSLSEGAVIGEIPSSGPAESIPTAGVVGPGSGGALPPQDPKDVPLHQFDKPTLQSMARKLGLAFKQNTIKAELVEMIAAKRLADAQATPEQTSDANDASPSGAPATEPVAPEAVAPTSEPEPVSDVAADAAATPVQTTVFGDSTPDPTADNTVTSAATTPVEAVDDADPGAGVVDTETGEVTAAEAVENVAAALGGEVIFEPAPAEVVPIAAAQPAPAAIANNGGGEGKHCARPGCGVDLSGENQDYVKLSQIKYRNYLCNVDYMAAKAGGLSAIGM